MPRIGVQERRCTSTGLLCALGDGCGCRSLSISPARLPAGTLPLKPDYDCDPSSCKPENNCRCASYEAPLPKDQMPQFILYTVRLAALPLPGIAVLPLPMQRCLACHAHMS